MDNYWLIKSEPETYGYHHLQGDGKGIWDGVRNYQARNFMREMRKGDMALFYHSGKKPEVAGIAEIVSDPLPDPTDSTGKWLAVEVVPHTLFAAPVPLRELKIHPVLEGMLLFRQSRLSVMPVTQEAFFFIKNLGTQGS